MKERVVVDASVVIKWFLPEPGADAAASLLESIARESVEAIVPELLLAETGNIVWKRTMQGLLAARDAAAIVESIAAAPFRVERMAPVIAAAVDIAIETGCTVYDAIYVALALQADAVVITADGKLARRLADTPYSSRVEWLTSDRV